MPTKLSYYPTSTPLQLVISSRIIFLMVAIFFPFLVDDSNTFYQSLLNYDGSWYQRIAITGYGLHYSGVADQRVAFFPLFPLITRLFPIDFQLSALLINNILFILSVPLFYAYMRQLNLGIESLIAITLLTFSPYSLYFSIAYTESIFIFLTLYLLYFAEKGAWYKALILAPFISATRNIGVFIVFPLGLIALKQLGWYNIFTFKKNSFGAWLTIFSVPLGLFSYMAFLYYYSGDPFAFSHIQSQWNRLPMTEGAQQLMHGLFIEPSVKEIYHSFFFFIALCLSFYLFKQKYYYQALWLITGPLLAASTGTFTSMARFVMAGSPFAYMAFSILISRTPWLKKNSWLIYLTFATAYGFFITIWMVGGKLA